MRFERSVPLVVLLLAVGLCGTARGAGLDPIPAHGYTGGEADPPCTVSADWLRSDAPAPSFRGAFANNCDFHQWAMREFLYLTQKGAKEDFRFLDLANPESLFCDPRGVPAAYPGDPKARCNKSETGLIHLRSRGANANAVSRIVFLPRGVKGPNTTFDADRQAGSNAVLVDQKGQVVYYTAQVNQTFYDFVAKSGYYKLQTVLAAPATTSFPVDSLEVKSAWRIAELAGQTIIPKARENFFTTQGLVCKDPACKAPVDALMAMVGLHIVGRIENHPEMVWATFEQGLNSPYCERTPDGSSNFSFYPVNRRCGDDKPFFANCNQLPKDDKTPSAICRAHPYGEPEASAGNTNNIQTLSASLYSLVPEKSLLRRYIYVGSVWTEKIPDTAPALIDLDDKSIRGSKKVANTSLESFTQEKGCLHCHTHQPPQIGTCFPRIDDVGARKNLYVSHLLGLTCQPKP